jgi:KDO2-lipid IV(A) lauroyltransferase
MGKKLGRLIQCLPRCRQSVVETNLQLCFPEKPTEERERIKNECYENIGIAIFEIGMSWWWSEKRLQPLVEIRGLCIQSNIFGYINVLKIDQMANRQYTYKSD